MGSVSLEGFGRRGGLNFKVVAGLTQPGSATENTIWVMAENMTGWIFSASEPAEPVEGMVWFVLDTSGKVSFNALKKNEIQIYLLNARQYVSGTWENVESAIYQSGKWVTMANTPLPLDSGWVQSATGGSGWSEGSVTFGDRLTIDNPKTTSRTALTHEKTYDLSDIKTISVVIDPDSTGLTTGYNWIAVVNDISFVWDPGSSGNKLPSAVVASTAFSEPGTITLDVSSLSGSYYLAILATRIKTIYCSKYELSF